MASRSQTSVLVLGTTIHVLRMRGWVYDYRRSTFLSICTAERYRKMKSAIFLLAGLLPVVLSLHSWRLHVQRHPIWPGRRQLQAILEFRLQCRNYLFRSGSQHHTAGWGSNLNPDGGMVNTDVVLGGLTTTEMPSSTRKAVIRINSF